MQRFLPTRRPSTHVERLHGELCISEWTTKTHSVARHESPSVGDQSSAQQEIPMLTDRLERRLR
jgi:hypothetical protein